MRAQCVDVCQRIEDGLQALPVPRTCGSTIPGHSNQWVAAVRDLWAENDLGIQSRGFIAHNLAPHASKLLTAKLTGTPSTSNYRCHDKGVLQKPQATRTDLRATTRTHAADHTSNSDTNAVRLISNADAATNSVRLPEPHTDTPDSIHRKRKSHTTLHHDVHHHGRPSSTRAGSRNSKTDTGLDVSTQGDSTTKFMPHTDHHADTHRRSGSKSHLHLGHEHAVTRSQLLTELDDANEHHQISEVYQYIPLYGVVCFAAGSILLGGWFMRCCRWTGRSSKTPRRPPRYHSL